MIVGADQSNLNLSFSCLDYICRLLQNNNISGSIPPEIGKLFGLHTLDLSNNEFSGAIPTSLGNLRGLQYL